MEIKKDEIKDTNLLRRHFKINIYKVLKFSPRNQYILECLDKDNYPILQFLEVNRSQIYTKLCDDIDYQEQLFNFLVDEDNELIDEHHKQNLMMNKKKIFESTKEKKVISYLSKYIFSDMKDFANIIFKIMDNYAIFIDDVILKPIDKKIIISNNMKLFNKFILNRNVFYWSKELVSSPIIKQEQFYYIRTCLLNIFNNDEKAYNYFLDFLSCKLKYPEIKFDIFFLFIDKGGSGKSRYLKDVILFNLFKTATINSSSLDNRFNAVFFNGTQFVAVEESDNYNNYEKIKELSSQKNGMKEEKNKEAIMEENFSTMIFFSNKISAIHIDMSDRRTCVFGGGKPLICDGKYNISWEDTIFGNEKESTNFKEQLDNNINNELKYFFLHLMQRKCNLKDFQTPLFTDLKAQLIDNSKNVNEIFLDDILEKGFMPFVEDCFIIKGSNKFDKDYFEYICKSLIKKNENGSINYYIAIETLFDIYKQYLKKIDYKSKYEFSSPRKFFVKIEGLLVFNKVFKKPNNLHRAYIENENGIKKQVMLIQILNLQDDKHIITPIEKINAEKYILSKKEKENEDLIPETVDI